MAEFPAEVASATITLTQTGNILVNGTATLESAAPLGAICYTTLDGMIPGRLSPITSVGPGLLAAPLLQNGRFSAVTAGTHTVSWVCQRQAGAAGTYWKVSGPTLDIWSTQ